MEGRPTKKAEWRHWLAASFNLLPAALLGIALNFIAHPPWLYSLCLFLVVAGCIGFGHDAAAFAWEEEYRTWLRMMAEAPEIVERNVKATLRKGA